MGHREDLLASAKRCLVERGYARTTARDLVNDSGTNLASIGYHFGSKEALLHEGMMEAIKEWGTEVEEALGTDLDDDAPPFERFVATWTRIIRSFTTHRALWIASVEALAQAERSPEVHGFVADALEQGRAGFPALFRLEAGTPAERQAAGALLQALMTGVGVQWLIDPKRAPSARDLAVALRIIGHNMKPAEPVNPKVSRPRKPATRATRSGRGGD